MKWGYKKGCNFLLSCDASYDEFHADNRERGCDFHNNAIGISNRDSFTENCYYMHGYSNQRCFDDDILSSLQPEYYGTYAGHDSKCFNSDVKHKGYNFSNLPG